MVEKSDPKHLLLVDGHSLAYRAFYALPLESFATSSGQPTNAVYGFTSMLINAIKDEKPTHIAIAFDVSRNTFRKELFSEYKANRAKTPDEFKSQLPLIHQVIGALKIPGLQVEGFEADDIIATLAKLGEKNEMRVSILTGDRDTFQLVNKDITVLYARKGVSDIARMTPDAVQEKYELTPEQYPDFAALRGDPSDNLPSIPSVGEKTAVKWIKEYGNLDELIKHASEISGKVGESLRQNLDQVRLNRKMTQLIQDVKLDKEIADLVMQKIDENEVNKVFTELEFKSLKERVLGKNSSSNIEKNKPSVKTKSTKYTKGVLKEFLERNAKDSIALELDFNGQFQEISNIKWGLANDTELLAFSHDEIDSKDRDLFIDWLQDKNKLKTVHGSKDFYHVSRFLNIELNGIFDDIEISSYLVNPGLRSYDLEDICIRVLGFSPGQSSESSGQLSFDTDSDLEALAIRAQAIYLISKNISQKLQEQNLEKLFFDLELPLAKLLSEMEDAGIAVDLKKLNSLQVEFEKIANGYEKDSFKIVGHEFNLASPKQLQTVLFDERKLPKTKKTKTGYTTDATALEELFASTKDPLLSLILKWRDITKLKQVAASLIPLVDKESRIHTTFNQTITSTGRLSSTEPNLQNIPIRTDQGKRIRDCFINSKNYECLLTADYSQIEMRIMAHL
ncbi:MAG: DNA polymerase I, partial [Actinobacteria bacterium]|nr:DNA polymerase I [Actinomycetota bacterium]